MTKDKKIFSTRHRKRNDLVRSFYSGMFRNIYENIHLLHNLFKLLLPSKGTSHFFSIWPIDWLNGKGLSDYTIFISKSTLFNAFNGTKLHEGDSVLDLMYKSEAQIFPN